MVYSVLKEPVIPVLWLNGSTGAVGIREAFLRAHEIRDIQADTPLERYALLRLLIVFAMDMLHPEDSYARRDLLDSGSFDAETFDAYVALCEQDAPRFDLFDPEHPFLQSKYDESLDAKAEKPVAAIIHSLPSGNNHIFIDHRKASTHEVSCDKAFRALVASYLFCVSGTAGPSSINNTPPLYTVIIRDNLFETIVINMLSVAEAEPLPYGIGMVPWRNYHKVVPKETIADVSLLEGLTWMPRRILLVPNEGGSISRVYCQAGLDFRGNALWSDPFVPKFKKKDGTFGTIKPELGRDLWRDAGTLLYDHNGAAVRQPQVLQDLFNIFDDDEIPEWIPIRAAGLNTNQAAYTGWYEDELSLPSALVHNQELADLFRNDADMIEKTQNQLYSNVQRYVDKPRGGSVSKEHEVATQCQQFFLQQAHDLLFGSALDEIIHAIPDTDHVNHFCDAVKGILKETIRHVLYSSGQDVKSVMQQMEAEKWIWISYSKLIEERRKYYV